MWPHPFLQMESVLVSYISDTFQVRPDLWEFHGQIIFGALLKRVGDDTQKPVSCWIRCVVLSFLTVTPKESYIRKVKTELQSQILKEIGNVKIKASSVTLNRGGHSNLSQAPIIQGLKVWTCSVPWLHNNSYFTPSNSFTGRNCGGHL